ncbi:MAG TPA: hypothetical protein VGL72_21730 [Bryobacteraceae bacterium]|jgi:hypothetical protein
MNSNSAARLGLLAAILSSTLFALNLEPPKAGKVEIMKASDVKPGMQAIAWTVFEGTKPEPVPIEIVGAWKNMWGPGQDVILGKMGGRAKVTNVAGGMSGSPVYIDGKLIGAVALRLSQFSPDAICGITPIENMLEIKEYDKSRPSDARTPEKIAENRSQQVSGNPFGNAPAMEPIATPLTFSGFDNSTLTNFGPVFNQLGITPVQGGAGSTLSSPKPVAGWEKALNPGEAVAGVLVSGDMSITGLGTVTYNDGKHILAFGHSFFNLGPVDMPMSQGNVLMTLASAYQPNKIANATEIVGALHQDRHSGIMGVLGQEAPMVPVTLKVRSFDSNNHVKDERDLHFNVFEHQKWTPYLMMMTLYNSLSEMNVFMDEATYRLNGTVDLANHSSLNLNTMVTTVEGPMPAPMSLAGWYGDKFNRMFQNAVKTPQLQGVAVTVDVLPERRVASIENAWVASTDVRPGEEVPVKVFLRPYRGERIERDFTVKIPAGLAKGDHRIMLSDADSVNRMQSLAGISNRYLDLNEIVSLINQERSNNKLYVSLLESAPTAYYDDKTLPSLPSSVLNVMQAGRATARPLVTAPESASEQMSLPFDYVINGSYSLKVTVK